MTSKERTDENNILSPRSPIFDHRVEKTIKIDKEPETIKIINESRKRQDGTPSFNKRQENTESTIGLMRQYENGSEFNISFTNENYNPTPSHDPCFLPSSEAIISTQPPSLSSQTSLPTSKLIHLSENHNNDNTNYRVSVVTKKSARQEVKQRFGSPVPVKGAMNKMKVMVENKIPNFGGDGLAFPEIPEKESSRQPHGKTSEHKRSKKKKILAPNVKILELQHNMIQLSHQPYYLFEENGKIIDSNSLREELRAFKISDDRHKKQGKLVKATNPIDMINVKY